MDDVEIYRVGQTGFDLAYEPDMMTQIVPLPIGKKDLNLSIEVANYSQRRGGVLGAPRLGVLKDMIAESRLRLLPEIIALTIIIVISFIGFNLFLLNRSNTLHLYLGILGVASILRQITIGEVLFKLLWPDGLYEMFEILRHGGLLISLAVSARFLRILFGKHINKKLLIGMEYLYYALGLLIFLTPIWLNSYLTLIAQPVAFWMLGYAIYIGVRYIKDYPGVEWLIAGALTVILVFSHDILIASLWLKGTYLQSYGMSIFIICYAVYVNKTSQSIQNRHSALANQLTELRIISTKKKELDVEVAATLKQLSHKLDRHDQKKTNDLVREISEHQIISDRQTILQQTLIESSEQFLDNLHHRFPNLTRSEEEICLLFRAKLSTKEIAQVRKITVESAKVARKRLRKRLNLKPKQDIYQFIASI
ncbi:MAG: 7TM diverse intracellular signaling domain-containing protein [Cyclobacteriaceae bacterium]